VSETLADVSSLSDLAGEPSPIGSTVDPATILDAVAEGILVFDPDTLRIAEANRGATGLLDRPHDELVGLPIVELLRKTDADRFAGHVTALVTGVTDATTMMLDYVRGDGGSIAVEVVLQPIELPGGRLVIVAIARDMRGRLQTQIRLQRLAEAEHARAAELNAVIRAMGEAVVVCAPDGRITLSNPAGELIFPDVEARAQPLPALVAQP
jgi:PAS domain S-box-containing protein